MSANKLHLSHPDQNPPATNVAENHTSVKNTSDSKTLWGVFLVVFLLNAAMRLWRLDLIEFKEDEASNLALTLRAILSGEWPTSGIGSSIGHQNLPLLLWILTPAAWLSRRPETSAALIAILDSLGTALLAAYSAKRFGLWSGLALGTLAATSPWQVYYSRKIWQQALVPSFSCIGLIALLEIIRKGRTAQSQFPISPWRITFLLSISTFAILTIPALHPVSVAPTGLLLLAILSVGWRLVCSKCLMPLRNWALPAALYFALLIVLSLPWTVWAIADFREHDGRNVWLLLSGGPTPGEQSRQADVLFGGWRLMAAFGYYPAASVPWLVSILISLLLIIGSYRAARNGHPVIYVWAWFLAAPAFVFLSGRPSHDHYFLSILPAGWLIASWALLPISNESPKARTTIIAASTATALALSLAGILSVANLVKALDHGPWSQPWAQYGVPLERLRQSIKPFRQRGMSQPIAVLEELAATHSLKPHTHIVAAGNVYLGAVNYLLTIDPPKRP